MNHLIRLARIADELDQQGRFDDANIITAILVREAQQQMQDLVNQGAFAVDELGNALGQGAWAANQFGQAVNPLNWGAAAVGDATTGVQNAANSYLNDWAQSNGYMKQPSGNSAPAASSDTQAPTIQSTIQQATAAHKANGTGWSVINKALANPNLSPTVKNQIKSQFAIIAQQMLHPAGR
jgi:hypothetical protein